VELRPFRVIEPVPAEGRPEPVRFLTVRKESRAASVVTLFARRAADECGLGTRKAGSNRE